jgi:hypothetical protein
MQQHEATPDLFSPFRTINFMEACMDISIVATIGFTTAAIIGIIVLVFSAGKDKGDSRH